MLGFEEMTTLDIIKKWLTAHNMTWINMGPNAVEAADITTVGLVGWTRFDENSTLDDVKAWLGY